MKKPTTKLMSIQDIKENPINPRSIEEEDYQKLVDSIRDFPNMLQLRPIVIDLQNTVIGGNQRLKACKELGIERVPTMQVTNQILEEVNQTRKESNKHPITYEELCKEFVIKDNVNSGQWSWDLIESEFNDLPLEEWGLETEYEIQNPIIDIEITKSSNKTTRAIQIDFDKEDYKEAKKLVYKHRDNVNIGKLLLDILRKL